MVTSSIEATPNGTILKTRARIYNNNIHAKIILLDEKISIVSSINFTKYPMSGITWEAGIVSIYPKTVNSIKESIKKYISIHIAKK